ncbi:MULTISPECIES: FAD-binding oxidoreductase [unclassified Nocardioides]|uniref:FAD-binding oxidoreductase n=1 Tax=unclassified Nocardioides TaxID=2615069 RepID=UPI003014E3D6
MSSSAPAGGWTTGRLIDVQRPSDRLVRLRFHVEGRVDHWPGQHYVLRLRAPDGYTAQRSYSIASDPHDPLLELMIECLPDGEVSGFMHDVAEVGDEFELRGPIGGWFTWTGEQPAICVVGGSGVVPAVSMARYAKRLGLADSLRVVAVGRTYDDLPYAAELEKYGAFLALTRENLGDRVAHPPWPDELAPLAEGAERAYVCGSVGFASFATRLLGEVGVRSDTIRVEQFGATS